MTPEELRAFLIQRQARFKEGPVQYGTQFRCNSGEIFNVFDSGKISVQGKRTELAAVVKEWDRSGLPPADLHVGAVSEAGGANLPVGPDRRVFVVYGHDTNARDALELLLRRMNLDPIVLRNLPPAGDTVIEKLERYLGEHGDVGFACVLMTPDDEGHGAGKPEEKRYRARQNVILELGMVLGRLGRRHVAILANESVEQPSDIGGLIYIPFRQGVDEVKFKLLEQLQSAGYTPLTTGL